MFVLQYGQCTQQHADGVSPAYSVVRPVEILGEIGMCLVRGRWRQREQLHRLVVERRDRLMDREGRDFARLCGGTGKSDGRRGGFWRVLRIVQCVREAGSPVTEIARNDEECVCTREVRRENSSE